MDMIPADRVGVSTVLLFDVQDWPCILSYHEFTKSAYQEANASAVIIVNTEQDAFYTLVRGAGWRSLTAVPFWDHLWPHRATLFPPYI